MVLESKHMPPFPLSQSTHDVFIFIYNVYFSPIWIQSVYESGRLSVGHGHDQLTSKKVQKIYSFFFFSKNIKKIVCKNKNYVIFAFIFTLGDFFSFVGHRII